MTQCVNARLGASGSMQTRTKLFVPAGGPLHASGGEKLPPRAVNLTGIESLFVNASLMSRIKVSLIE
jgi:hypothetical protein